jgi:flagellar motor protein MotB
MKRTGGFSLLRGLVAAVVSLSFVGCVPYQTYEALKADYTRQKSTNEDLVVKYNRAIQDLMRLRAMESSLEAAKAQAANLQTTNKTLLAQLQKFDSLTPQQEKDLPPGVIINKATNEMDISEGVLFNSGDAKLKSPAAMKLLDDVLAMLERDRPNEFIHISGHTDNVPLKQTAGLWHTNQRLAYERAYTVFNYFKDHGLNEERMVIHSLAYLQPRPDADNATPEGRAKNRRVSIGLGGLRM